MRVFIQMAVFSNKTTPPPSPNAHFTLLELKYILLDPPPPQGQFFSSSSSIPHSFTTLFAGVVLLKEEGYAFSNRLNCEEGT